MTTVFIPKEQTCISDSDIQFKKWLADTVSQVKDSFDILDDSLTLIIKEHQLCKVRNGKVKESMEKIIVTLLKEYSEPPFDDYDLEITKETYFVPTEVPNLTYDSWCEFPLIKVTHKDTSISYEEIRGRINGATIINHTTNDTTFVQWIYDNGKIEKQILNLH